MPPRSRSPGSEAGLELGTNLSHRRAVRPSLPRHSTISHLPKRSHATSLRDVNLLFRFTSTIFETIRIDDGISWIGCGCSSHADIRDFVVAAIFEAL